MSDDNKLNLLFFEGPSVRELYAVMDDWQKTNRKRFQSITIQKEGDAYCCIALTNPSEVIIVGGVPVSNQARVINGHLAVTA
ncbi:MAG: hypothetical protein WDN08_00115 [Rhizomicrobium sp.]